MGMIQKIEHSHWNVLICALGMEFGLIQGMEMGIEPHPPSGPSYEHHLIQWRRQVSEFGGGI